MRYMPAYMQALNWSDLQIFLAIARAGQLAKAARQIGIDATTAGRRLRRLELGLGQSLFEQTRQGQTLTEAGELLLESVEAMSVVADRVVPVNQSASGPSGTLRISVSEGFGSWFLASHLPEFAVLYPNVTVDLVASSNYLNLSRREADVAVYLSRPQAGPLIARKLAPYRLGLYANLSYLKGKLFPRTLTDLGSHRLVGYIPDLLAASELQYSEEIHPGQRAALRSTSINAQFSLLASGAGIGVLPCFIGNASSRLVRVLPQHALERSFWLVTHKDSHNRSKVSAFNDWIERVLVEGGRQELMGN